MKILFRIALVIFILTVLAVIGVGLKLDSIAKVAVEEGGTYATGVETKLESADLGIFNGTLAISGLTIANPDGYQADHFFSLRNAGLAVDPESVQGDTVVIPEILVEGLHLSIERTEKGTNYDKILENLQRFESSDTGSDPASTEPAGQPAPDGQQQKFVVRNIRISDVQANVLFEALGEKKDVLIDVPDFTLENVGNSDDSQSIADIISTIVSRTMEEAMKNAGDLIPEDLLNDAKGKLAGVKEAAKQTQKDVEAGIQTYLESGDKSDLEDAADKAKEGLKGLLGKDE